jgi:YkoY family integral membrane protein
VFLGNTGGVYMQQIINSYSEFFSWDMFIQIITTPSNLGIIFSLIILEGLLSADNALVLATMVSDLKDEKKRKLAIFAGMWGAYIFRFLIIGFGVYLIGFWWIKVLGAAYLMWLSLSHLLLNKNNEKNKSKKGTDSFWLVVLQVEMMDIAFSIDSVSAAFGISEDVWVLFLGAIFGILMMRGVAEIFVNLLEKYPELDKTAYILIAIISIKMLISVFGIHIPELVFFILVLAAFALTFILHHINDKRSKS